MEYTYSHESQHDFGSISDVKSFYWLIERIVATVVTAMEQDAFYSWKLRRLGGADGKSGPSRS